MVIEDDDKLERSRTFIAKLDSIGQTPNPLHIIDPDTVVVTITDNDGKHVATEQCMPRILSVFVILSIVFRYLCVLIVLSIFELVSPTSAHKHSIDEGRPLLLGIL